MVDLSNRPSWLRDSHVDPRLSVFTCDEEGSGRDTDLRGQIGAAIELAFVRSDAGGSTNGNQDGDSQRAGSRDSGGLSLGDGGDGGDDFSGERAGLPPPVQAGSPKLPDVPDR